jgi:hypothetical protein
VTASDNFDPATLQGTERDWEALRSPPPKPSPRTRQREAFLKGPIPWAWLEVAARLPGKALQVALLLWREAGCCKRRTVTFCLLHGQRLGMGEDTTRRSVRRLASAGLVTVRHRPGRGLEVTILDLPTEETAT